jgi:hypothetical protein
MSRKNDRQNDIEHAETLSLLAELALGLAGFTGIAATFGGRERAYSGGDRFRIELIFMLAGSALAGSLTALTLSAAGCSTATSFGWASLVAAAIHCRPAFISFKQAIAVARDPEMSPFYLIVVSAVVLLSSCLGLQIGNLWLWRDAWPLLAASSLQLGWGLFLFARLLTQPT